MLRSLLIGLLCLATLSAKGQRKSDRVFEPLKPYDFSEGDYSLIFIPESRQGDEKVAYYTDKEEVLNVCKKVWVFDHEAIVYPFGCLDGYDITLAQKGKSKAGFALRFRCQAFVSGSDYWHVNVLKTVVLTSLMEKVYGVDTVYENLTEARGALAEARQNAKVVFIPDTDWERYDGYFFFSRPNPNFSGRAPYTEWEDVLKEVQEKIHDEYPDQNFDLTLASHGSGKHYPQITFRIHSKKAFFDQFKSYLVTNWGWREFKPKLSVWKKK